MRPEPTGRLRRTGTGSELVLSRTFRAPADDVWASVTEPERTARWFGPWSGDARPGRMIRLQLVHEEGEPWCDLRIEECEPPRRLVVSMVDESGDWRMEVLLSEVEAGTELRLVHHLDTEDGIGETGPGWEYYLDLLDAAHTGAATPDFGDYHPAMKPYFDALPTSAEGAATTG